MWLFKQSGFDNALRIGHVIVAVMWMGLLWFFNFVQTPAFAEMDPNSRNVAMDKITWRALWWFRWAAAATVVRRHQTRRSEAGGRQRRLSQRVAITPSGVIHLNDCYHS